MFRVNFTCKYLLMILLFSCLLIGCSSSKSTLKKSIEAIQSAPEKILSNEYDAVLKKRALLLPIMNQSELRKEKIQEMTELFLTLLNDNENIITLLPPVQMPTSLTKRSPEFGVLNDPAVVKKAEEMGMDVLITPVLSPLDISIRRTGIWPLRKLKREIEITIAITALDITNGTIYLTNIETRKIRLKDEVWEEDLDSWKLEQDEGLVYEELALLLEDQAKAITEVLNKRPWTGKIIHMDNGIIRISGGEDIGITEGSLFDVFGKGDSIKSYNGDEYHFRGPKIGVLEIKNVMKDYSDSEVLSGQDFEIGFLVRLKE